MLLFLKRDARHPFTFSLSFYVSIREKLEGERNLVVTIGKVKSLGD